MREHSRFHVRLNLRMIVISGRNNGSVLHQRQGKRALFAYDTREICEADPIVCPRPLLNLPNQDQDLGKRDQEKLVICNMKSDPKDIHQSQKRLSIT